jgi:hypothetical protein
MFEKIYNWLIQSKKANLIDVSKPIDRWLNDPSTPDLVSKTAYSKTKLPLTVSGFVGGGYKIVTPEGRAANCYSVINFTLNNITPKIEKFPGKWAATKNLNVYPVAGQDFNAYYDRNSLKFFYGYDPKAKKNIYTADSSDIVSHELGHALLDATRPDFWNVQSYEVWALHESFGDIVAILSIMENKDVLNLAVKQTSGDLSKSNTISRLAEEFGKAIYNITKGASGYTPFYLRDAVNNFNYVSPDKLSDNTPDNVLSRECHNFSRVWTGTWYECLVGIYKFETENNKMQALDALVLAKETMSYYFFSAIGSVPLTSKLFEALATKILLIDSNRGGKYSSVLNKVFSKRNIIKGIGILNNFDLSSMNDNKKFLRIQSVDGETIYADTEKTKIVKIFDFINKKSLIDKKLQNLEIEIPFEDRYEMSASGLSMQSVNNLEENVNIAVMCINSLSTTKQLDRLFKIEQNKLIRDKIIN